MAHPLDDDREWILIEEAVDAFVKCYPVEFAAWKKSMAEDRAEMNEYGLVKEEHKELRQAEVRRTLSFPVFKNRINADDDCLFPVIQREAERMGYKFPKDDAFYRRFIDRFGHLFLAGTSW